MDAHFYRNIQSFKRKSNISNLYLSIKLIILLSVLLVTGGLVLANSITKPHEFSDDTIIYASQVNENFDIIYSLVNGNIDNNNISATANIDQSKINGAPFASASDSVPTGAILMWSGALTSIPSGWQLCDGTNGTPDLRDRFIFGATNGTNQGDTGGCDLSDPSTCTVLPHTHSINDPGHEHEIEIYWQEKVFQGGGTGDRYRPGNNILTETALTGITILSDDDGDNSIADDPSTDHSWMPPYYRLAFIMKL